jgi:hypothetical protein
MNKYMPPTRRQWESGRLNESIATPSFEVVETLPNLYFLDCIFIDGKLICKEEVFQSSAPASY